MCNTDGKELLDTKLLIKKLFRLKNYLHITENIFSGIWEVKFLKVQPNVVPYEMYRTCYSSLQVQY